MPTKRTFAAIIPVGKEQADTIDRLEAALTANSMDLELVVKLAREICWLEHEGETRHAALDPGGIGANYGSNTSAAAGAGGVHVRIVSIGACRKNFLVGFFSVKLGCIVINDLTYHSASGKTWIDFPARPYKKSDGSDGWSKVITFDDRFAEARIRYSVLIAVEARLAQEGSRTL
jgi:hypothetical protein